MHNCVAIMKMNKNYRVAYRPKLTYVKDCNNLRNRTEAEDEGLYLKLSFFLSYFSLTARTQFSEKNMELVHDCCTQNSHMRTEIIKTRRKKREKQRRVDMVSRRYEIKKSRRPSYSSRMPTSRSRRRISNLT